MSAFIDERRGDFGVEPICRTLEVSASAYYQRKTGRQSARSLEDERLLARIEQLHAANYSAYGYRRMWKALLRAGERVGRDRDRRLMKGAGIAGAKHRGRPWRTTKPDPEALRHPDLVERDFSAERPNQLWVADLTYLRSWQGLTFLAFVIDAYSRRVVGWQLATHMRASLCTDALRMALSGRPPGADVALVHHSDRGSQLSRAGSASEAQVRPSTASGTQGTPARWRLRASHALARGRQGVRRTPRALSRRGRFCWTVTDSLEHAQPLPPLPPSSPSDDAPGKTADAAHPSGPRRSRRLSLLWWVLLPNCFVLMVAFILLAATPITISAPIEADQLAILFLGLAALVGLNLVLLRRALSPLFTLTHVMSSVDPDRPGRRLLGVDPRSAEGQALADAFNAMLDRLERSRREAARTALAAQEAERLAQELHDEIGQTLRP